jgi:hypothetical protein
MPVLTKMHLHSTSADSGLPFGADVNGLRREEMLYNTCVANNGRDKPHSSQLHVLFLDLDTSIRML